MAFHKMCASCITFIFLHNLFDNSGYAITWTAKKIRMGRGKRCIVTIVHYRETHYSNNKLYLYMNAQMFTRVQSFDLFYFLKKLKIVLKIP